jgi:hypothetical protein
MAEGTRRIFRIDQSSQQTYGEDLVGASRTLSAVASDAERCNHRSQSYAAAPFNK